MTGSVIHRKVKLITMREEGIDLEGKIQTLDLRPMPPFERHEKIFEIWNSLQSGETLRIVNDHNPKPLRYQFEAVYKEKYVWEYEQKGPKDWVVKIRRI